MKPRLHFLVLLLPACSCAALPLAETGDHAGSPQASFNNSNYRLGYTVYLKHGDLQAAFQVARKALQSRPDDRYWLRSYAQVAEWTGQPMAALVAWARLARLDNSEEAWSAVGRLAPGLLDDEELLAYQERTLARQPGNEVLLRGIAQTYERLGRIDDGLLFFEKLGLQQGSELLLDIEATMADRSGRDAQALALLTRLNAEYGPRENWLLRMAAMSYLQGDQTGAWRELQGAEAVMPVTAAGYWQTYAQLSVQLGYRDAAGRAYRKLLENGKASAAELMEYVSLLENEDGLAAARLSETVFRSSGIDSAMISALFLYQREQHPLAALALLRSASPQQIARLESNPDFLEQRGQLKWQQKKPAQAQADFQRGLRLQPGDPRFLLQLVNLALDQSDASSLRRLLNGYHRRASLNPVLWLSWANGWSFLGEPARALPFLRAYCQRYPHDLFAQILLADSYENSGDAVRAEKQRQRVLAAPVLAVGSDVSAQDGAALRDALLALRLQRVSADAGRVLLQSHLKRDGKGRPDPAAREMVLAWLLAQGNEEKAQAWRNLAGPPMAVAVAQQGVGEEDAEAQDDRSQVVPAFVADAMRLGAQAESLQQGGLLRYSGGVEVALPLARRWDLAFALRQLQQRSLDESLLRDPPSGDRESLALHYGKGRSAWSLELLRTALLADYFALALKQEYSTVSRYSIYWQLLYNADAPESAALLAVGVKDGLQVGGRWLASRGWFLGGNARGEIFHSQHREKLGEGNTVNLEAGRDFYYAAMPQALTLVATLAHFQTEESGAALSPDLQAIVPIGTPANAGFFIPESFHQLGLVWAFGAQPGQSYVAKWQWHGALGINYASNSGPGYDINAGLQGAVFGRDQLRVLLNQGEGGQGNGSTLRQAGLAYQYFF